MNFPEQLPIRNFLTGRPYVVVPASAVPNVDATQTRVAAICNEPHIYTMIFSGLLNGRPYSSSDAEGFLSWAQKGWDENTHFVFFIMDSRREIVGCLDIKSHVRDNAEIGYWASALHPGNMTQALASVMKAAEDEGFYRFVAYVKADNHASVKVLQRVGFVQDELFSEKPDCNAFVHCLTVGNEA